VDVNERFAGVGDAHQRIGLRGDLADPRADGEDEVGGLDPRDKARRGAGAEVAEIIAKAVVDDVLAAERATGGEVVGREEAGNVGAGRIAPPAAADQHQRPLGRGQEAAQFGEVGGAGMGAHRAVGADRGDLGHVAQHVLGQRDDDRAGPAGGRDLKRLAQQLGDALGQVDLRHPFGERRVHLVEIDLLKRLAVDLVARDLADQHDHRGRILERGVDSDRGVARAGAARHQQHARRAGQFAIGLGHKRGAALLAAGDKMDFGRVVERVEDFKIALAGDAERHLDAVRLETADDKLAAAQSRKIRRHRYRPLAVAPPVFETMRGRGGRGLSEADDGSPACRRSGSLESQ
jgi:hypothetical protein